MSVTLVCSSCGEVLTFHAPPVSACSKCATPIDPAIRQRLEGELAYAGVRRPTLITIGAAGSAFVGAIFLLFLVLAPFNIGTYSIDGEGVTGPEFLRRLGVVWVVYTFLLLAIPCGVVWEKTWARHLMMLFWVTGSAVSIGMFIRDRDASHAANAIFALIATVAAYWYLYETDGVNRYYSALERRAGK